MTTNAQLAKKISDRVEFETVVVRRAEVDAAFDPYELPAQLALESSYRCSHSILDHKDHKRLCVTIEFKFDCREVNVEESLSETAAFSLDATFWLVYLIREEGDFDGECLHHFANLNGPYNAWPYWRELVQTATTRAGLPGVVIPLFRPPIAELPPKPEKTEETPAMSEPTRT